MTSIEIARRVLARDAQVVPGVSTGDSSPLQVSCTRLTESLTDAMGDAGCTALLARALTRTEHAHPVLKQIRHIDHDIIRLDDVSAGIDSCGIVTVSAAIEALFVALIDILIRLIGEEMTIRLVDHGGTPSGSRDGAST